MLEVDTPVPYNIREGGLLPGCDRFTLSTSHLRALCRDCYEISRPSRRVDFQWLFYGYCAVEAWRLL